MKFRARLHEVSWGGGGGGAGGGGGGGGAGGGGGGGARGERREGGRRPPRAFLSPIETSCKIHYVSLFHSCKPIPIASVEREGRTRAYINI
jgi:hypothetical protein